MLKLRDIRAGNINQRRILLHDLPLNQLPHTKLPPLNPQPLQIRLRKNQRSEIPLNNLKQRLRTLVPQTSSTNTFIATIAINANVIDDVTIASGAESFDGEDVAFFHALGGGSCDEGDLFIAVDTVA